MRERLRAQRKDEVPPPQIAERHERVLDSSLDHDERHSRRPPRAERADDERAANPTTGARLSPKRRLPTVRTTKTAPTMSSGGAALRRCARLARAVLGQHHEGEHEGDAPEHHLEDEHRPPADALDDDPADRDAQNRAAGTDHRPPAHRLHPVAASRRG